MNLSKIITWLIAFIVLGGVAVAAPGSYPIYGVVTLDGVPASGMEINLQDLTKGGFFSTYTSNGEIVKDMSDIILSWGKYDDIKVTYCVADSRCKEKSIMFKPTGIFKDISIDLPREIEGLKAPYIVHGIIYKDGSPMQLEEFVIRNEDKGFEKQLTTNEFGEYEWNLANWDYYDTGDLISLTYSGKKVSAYAVNNGYLNLDLYYVTASEGGGGNGGSNNGNQGTVDPKPDDPIVDPVVDPVVDPEDPVIDEPEKPKSKAVLIIVLVILVLIVLGAFYLKKKKEG